MVAVGASPLQFLGGKWYGLRNERPGEDSLNRSAELAEFRDCAGNVTVSCVQLSWLGPKANCGVRITGGGYYRFDVAWGAETEGRQIVATDGAAELKLRAE